MGVLIEDGLPSAAFVALANLERHWSEGPRPVAVSRLQQSLDDAASDLWTPGTAIHHSQRKVHPSVFELSHWNPQVARRHRAPGGSRPDQLQTSQSVDPSAPVRTRSPAANRPLSWIQVLVAECISHDDPVGRASRAGWTSVARELIQSRLDIEVTIMDNLRCLSVRAAVEETRPDILVISAHAFHAEEANSAGLVIGETPSLGIDIGQMPPLVILSACHTSPRGGGAVSISDLLLRQGATAVISTLVPVDVRHNAQFMARFFRYLELAAGTDSADREVVDVWHRAQTANVVIDLAYGHPRLVDWCFERVDGVSPIEKFMSTENELGRLRLPHLYEDAEARLLRIASAQGDEDQIRNWLVDPGYLPESMLYVLIGNPELIRLKPAQ